MSILAISSQVVAGHVGNSAAQFVLQVLGHDVWAVPTVLLSHHPGHARPAGRATSADELAALLASLTDGGWMESVSAVMTGYFASPQQTEIAAQTIRTLTTAWPGLPVLIDPIIGDADEAGTRVYVADGVPEAIRDTLMPLATMTTPNVFELSILTDTPWPLRDPSAIFKAAMALPAPETLVTSVPGSSPGMIANLAFDGKTLTRHETPMSISPPNGVGDVTAAVYLGNRLKGVPVSKAAAAATGTVSALIARARNDNLRELPLIAGRADIVDASSAG